MTYTTCFDYPAEVPPGIDAAQPGPRRMPYTACYSYPADTSSLLGMPVGGCFSYSVEAPPGLRRMTYGTCFRY